MAAVMSTAVGATGGSLLLRVKGFNRRVNG